MIKEYIINQSIDIFFLQSSNLKQQSSKAGSAACRPSFVWQNRQERPDFTRQHPDE